MKELFLYEIVMKALLKSRGKWLSAMRLENLEAYTPEDEVEMIKQFILEAKGPICSDIQERDDGIWVAILSGDELKVIQGG